MTAAKLRELEAKATEGSWRVLDSVNPIGDMELVCYLRNHTQDFIRLIEAAEHMLKMYDAPDSAGSSLNYYASLQDLRQALAAFKEKS